MQPLVELRAAFRLYAVCIPCGRMELMDLDQLIQHLGTSATVTDVRRRLRCRTCGELRPDVRVVYVGVGRIAAGFSYRAV
jgi:ribosomal protein S14